MPPSHLLTINDAVQRYAVSRKTLRRLLDEGALEGTRRAGANGPEWVFPAEQLEELGYARRDGGADPGSATPPARRPVGRIVGMVVLLVLLLAGAVALLAGDVGEDDVDGDVEDEALVALVAGTSAGDRVGAVGQAALVAVPDDRVPVLVDRLDRSASLPRYVLVATAEDADDVAGELLTGGAAVVAEGSTGLVLLDLADSELAAAPTTTEAAEEPVTTTTEAADEPATTTTEAAEEPATTTTAAPTTTTPPDVEPEAEVEGSGDDAPTDPAGVVRDPAPEGTVIVAEGEHFWSIAERVVLDADPDADLAEVTAYWAALVEVNAERLPEPGNPDLLFPGQELVLPSASLVP